MLRAWRLWMPGVVLAAMVAVAFAPAFSGGWVLDDDAYVTANPQLRTVDGLGQIWLHPLAHTSLPDRYALLYTMFWAEYHVWGLSPLGFHAVNIALHAACVVLLWRLLVQLKVPGAWLAAAIFAVHPVCVESVAWVTEGKNTLSMLFALASMLCYLRFEPVEASDPIAALPPHPGPLVGGEGENRRLRYYAFSLALFAAALLSKTQVVALPIVLLMIYWWKRGRISWNDVKPLSPFFGLAVLLGALTVFVETHFNGAVGYQYSQTITERFLIVGQAVWFYVGKLVWPHPLTFIYPRWMIDANAFTPYSFLMAAIAVVAALWLARNKIGRGPLAVTLIFVGLLFPILGLFNVCFYRFSFVADHFQYHGAAAIVAIITATAWTLAQATGRLRLPVAPGHLRIVGGTVAAVILGTFTLLSIKHSALYASPEALYADTVEKNPDCWMAHGNLANALKNREQYTAAMEHYREALMLNPDYVQAHVNLGWTLACTGHLDDAITEYRAAIRLMPADIVDSGGAKTFAAAYNSLGAALEKLGQPEAARGNFEQSVCLNSNIAEAHFNLGANLFAIGKTVSAIEHFRHALQLDPNYAEAHGNLGAALATTGHLDQAIVEYRQAVRLKPNYSQAQYNLGLALLGTGQAEQAIPAFKATLRLNHNDVQCAIDLATAYAQLRRPADALEAADRAGNIARSTGQTAEEQKIQAWIAKYRQSVTISR